MAVRKHLLILLVLVPILLLVCVSAAHAEKLTSAGQNLAEAERNLEDHGLVLEDVVNEYFGEEQQRIA